jgi:DNA-binding transcriptional LysR family regulator
MNIHQVKIFYVTAQTLSITKTAKQLNLTQPSISIQLKALEDDLNVKLFDRVKQRLFLTDAGKLFYKYAEEMLSLMDKASSVIDAFKAGSAGRLSIGASSTIGLYVLPQYIAEFRNKFPDAGFSISILNREEAMRKCLANQLDFAFVQSQVLHRSLDSKFFFRDELIAVCSPGNPVCRETKLRFRSLEKGLGTLVLREEGSEIGDLVIDRLGKLGVKLDSMVDINTTEGIKKLIEANLGIGIVSKITVDKELKDGILVSLDIQGFALKRDFYIVFNKNRKFSPLMGNFYEFIASKISTHVS